MFLRLVKKVDTVTMRELQQRITDLEDALHHINQMSLQIKRALTLPKRGDDNGS